MSDKKMEKNMYNKKKLANIKKMSKNKMAKPIGARVQSPDQQYKTGQMGKQPIKVYP